MILMWHPKQRSIQWSRVYQVRFQDAVALTLHSSSLPFLGCVVGQSKETLKTMDCRVVDLYPDDVLYIPKGVLHEAEALSNTSAHVTFGMLGQQTYFDFAMAICNRTLASEDCHLLQRAWKALLTQPEAWLLHRQLPVWQLTAPDDQADLLETFMQSFEDSSTGLAARLQAELHSATRSYHDEGAVKRIMHSLSQPATTLPGLVSKQLVSEEAKTYKRERRGDGWSPTCAETCTCSGWYEFACHCLGCM
jgi:hypothetical protein